MEKETDVESGKPRPIGHFKQVFDQGVVTPEIINWPYSGSGTEEDPYIVTWIDDDPRNPMRYSDTLKWALVALVAMATLAVSFISSAYSGGTADIIREFGASTEVVTLGISLFVLGFAIGPLLWAPLSELYGRQYLFIGTYAMLTAFNAGACGSQNIETLVILRFFAGAFGSSPLTNAGGVIADMFPARQRGVAMSLFASAPFLGPTLGPIVGGFVGQTVGWRWIEGVMAIFSGVVFILGTIYIPETYGPVLLRQRAKRLSKLSGKVYKSKVDADQGKVTLRHAFSTALSRPWVLLIMEPIVLLLSIYMAIVYGTLYMMFGAFPIVYQEQRGWSPGIGGLAFIGVMVGMILAVAYSIWDNKRYLRAIEKDPSGFAPPEARLPPTMVGGCAIPIGLFWFAWTNYPSIHWSVSIIAGAPFGFGMVLVFLGIMNYLIDSYVIFAASVLAANSVLRSLFGAIFPLFTTYMYEDLGIHWASTIPAFLALACVPFPFIFYKYGPAIRVRCKFAAEADLFVKKMRGEVPTEDTVEEGKNQSEDSSASNDTTAEEKAIESDAATRTNTNVQSSPSQTHRPSTRRERRRGRPLSRQDSDYSDREAEAIDYSYDDESHQPESSRFQRIRTGPSETPGGANASQSSFEYQHDPFTLDRVNTSESFKGMGSLSRGASRVDGGRGTGHGSREGSVKGKKSDRNLASKVSLGRLRSKSVRREDGGGG